MTTKSGLTAAAIGVIVRGLSPVIREQFARRDDRLAALDARLAALESQPQLKWMGVWREGQPYAEANLVTRRGLWMATRVTAARPGEDDSWKLIVKELRPE
jgi:hypothetical protein